MKHLAIIILLSVTVVSSAYGQAPPYVKLPAEVKAQPGRLVKLAAESNGKMIRWVIASDEADLIVSESGRWAIFSAPKSGRYLIIAWTAAGDEPTEGARCWVVVGDPVPPTPPDPPGPRPEPTDEWYPILKASYMSDVGKGSIERLAAVWRQSAPAVRTSPLATGKEFLDTVIIPAVKSMVGNDLPATRKAVAACLDKVLPTAINAPLDVSTREQCAAAFLRVSVLLDALKGVK